MGLCQFWIFALIAGGGVLGNEVNVWGEYVRGKMSYIRGYSSSYWAPRWNLSRGAESAASITVRITCMRRIWFWMNRERLFIFVINGQVATLTMFCMPTNHTCNRSILRTDDISRAPAGLLRYRYDMHRCDFNVPSANTPSTLLS